MAAVILELPDAADQVSFIFLPYGAHCTEIDESERRASSDPESRGLGSPI
jgi:hypothetical protein